MPLGRTRNDTTKMSHDTNNPRELRDLALACAREGDGACTWDQYLLTPTIAAARPGSSRSLPRPKDDAAPP